MLELHCHTTYSDGTLTPTELVAAALARGVRALAITDHDTIGGWDEAYAAAAGTDLEIIPGLELSTVKNGRSLHILGFYPDPERLKPVLAERLAGRQRRAQEMAEKLAALGYPIELPTLGPGMAPGRPHLAAALVKAGHVRSPEEAFDRFLGDDRPACVSYEPLSSEEGVALLRQSGAVPVWAHPYLFRGGGLELTLRNLVEAGLLGIEVYHPHHSFQQVATLESLSQQYKLLKTGGSDYHGPQANAKPDDWGLLNLLRVPLDLLTPLKDTAQTLRQEGLSGAIAQ